MKYKKVDSEPEVNLLKLNMSAHFFFNIMNSIYHSIRLDPDQAEVIVLQLSEVMKYQIYECHKPAVELSKEIKAIHDYIQIQQIRLSKKPVINISVKGDLKNKMIPPYLLMKLVENAFKYGLEKQLNNHYLDIQLEISKNELTFEVINSKPVQDTDVRVLLKNRESGSVKERLEILYPNRHQLTMSENEERYSVSLNLQIH